MQTKILLTGSTGTLGLNILDRFRTEEDVLIYAPVRRLDHKLIQQFAGRVQFIDLELSDPVHTAQIFERVNPHIIIHSAASGLRPPKGSWFELMKFNVESTMRLFEMNCRFDHDSRFIYISTGLVYREQGRPLREDDPVETLHPYGASKAASDLMLQAAAAEFRRNLTILRPFAFTGPHDGGGRLFPLILDAALHRREQGLTAGTQIRDFCAVQEIADAVARVVHRKQESTIEIFNLGSGESLALRTLIERVMDELHLDASLVFGRSGMHRYEPSHLVADISKARSVLDWKPSTRLSHAVWKLAQQIAPELNLKEPEKFVRPEERVE